MADDRISKLSERFRTHQVGPRPTSSKSRERRSLYIDTDLLKRLDQAHKALNHDLYPKTVNKSAFLEAVMEYGLAHVDEVKETLTGEDEQEESSDNP